MACELFMITDQIVCLAHPTLIRLIHENAFAGPPHQNKH